MKPLFFRADNHKEQMSLTIYERKEENFEFSVFSRYNPVGIQTVTLTKDQILELLSGLVLNTNVMRGKK